jgi:hypothetical protein
MSERFPHLPKVEVRKILWIEDDRGERLAGVKEGGITVLTKHAR